MILKMIALVTYLLLTLVWQLSVAYRLQTSELYMLVHKRLFIVAAIAALCMVFFMLPMPFEAAAVGIIRFWLVMVGAFTLVWVALIVANIYSSVRYGFDWFNNRNRVLLAVLVMPVGWFTIEPKLRKIISLRVAGLFAGQCRKWELASKNFKALKDVKLRGFAADGFKLYVQCNPARIISTTAKIDNKSISERKCFLCPANRPKEQDLIPWRDYDILVNPYPIFDPHLTIPFREHIPQLIRPHLTDMLALAKELPGWAVFYNGPKCGASAPDHFHFQAVFASRLPLWLDYNRLEKSELKDGVFRIENYGREVICLEGTEDEVVKAFDELMPFMHYDTEEDSEPMMNVVCVSMPVGYKLFVLPRSKYRPSQYFDGKFTISPGTVEMCGVMIAPRFEDYDKLALEDIMDMYSQVSYRVAIDKNEQRD